MISIPFNKALPVGAELKYVQEAIATGAIAGNGPYTRRCHTLLENTLGVTKALLTTSCTDALEMAAVLLHIGPDDEVIVPSFTFVSTANAFALRGARPIFCDIRQDTLNMDEQQLEKLITPRTKAIIPVHYAGIGCAMETINEIASRHGIPVIEDNAHGLFGQYRGRYLGTWGTLAAQSFHESKSFSCGEGGALLINDAHYAERAEIIREKGTDRSRFLRGQVDKYGWVDVGASYLPSDILAAYLFAQLEARETILANRKRIWEQYAAELSPWATAAGVQLPTIPPECEPSWYIFYLLMPDLESRTALIARLQAQNIRCLYHYLPLHLSPMGRQFGFKEGDCPVTEWVSDRLVRLPFYNDMTTEEIHQVVTEITNK